MRAILRRFVRDKEGATAIEYGLIVALIAIALIAAFRAVAGPSTSMWSSIASAFRTATGN